MGNIKQKMTLKLLPGVIVFLGSISAAVSVGTLTVTVPGYNIQADIEISNLTAGPCSISWGDDDVDTFQTGTTSTHTYSYADEFEIAGYCFESAAVNLVEVGTHYVGNKITGIDVTNATNDQIIPVECPLTRDPLIQAQIATGTNVTIEAEVVHNGETTTILDGSAASSNDMTFSQSFFETCDLYSIKFSFSNPLTPSPIEIYSVLAIQMKISALSIAGYTGVLHVPVGEPFTVDVSFTGQDATMTYAVMDETDTIMQDYKGVYCDGDTTGAPIQYAFNVPAVSIFNIEASNFINIETLSIRVEAVYQVNSFSSVSITDQISYHTDPVTFEITVSSLAAQVPMGLVTATFDFGDENSNTLQYDLALQTLSTDMVKSLNHLYTNAGDYDTVITINNNLPVDPLVQLNTVTIVYLITNVALNNTNDAEHPWSQEWTVDLVSSNTLPLQKLIITANYGDGSENDVFSMVDLPAGGTYPIKHQFKAAGNFSITVTLANAKDTFPLTTEQNVVWDCWTSEKFFDPQHESSDKPQKFFATENPFTIIANVQSAPNTCSSTANPAAFNWTMFQNDTDNLDPYPENYPSNTSRFEIAQGTLQTGLFRVHLEVCYPHIGACLKDFMFIQCELPPLVAQILDSGNNKIGKTQIGSLDRILYLNTLTSGDPAEGTDNTVAVHLWRCKTDSQTILSEDKVDEFLANSVYNLADYATKDCNGTIPNGRYFSFDPSKNEADQFYLICYKITKSIREAEHCIGLKVNLGSYPQISIKCISNCGKGACGKVQYATIKMDIDILDKTIDNSTADFLWTVSARDNPQSSFRDITHDMTTDVEPVNIYGVGFKLLKKFMVPGGKYVVTCEVRIPGRQVTSTSISFQVNNPPYNGTCSIDKTEGKVLLDEFCVTCKDWKDEYDREVRGEQDDESGLEYSVVQKIADSAVPDILLVSWDTKLTQCFVLNGGGTDNQSIVTVRVRDICLNYNEWNTTVTLLPVIDAAALSEPGNTQAPQTITELSENVTGKIDAAVADQNVDKSLNLLNAKTTVLSAVEIPPPDPVVAVNPTPGGLIDVNPDGSSVSADEAITDLTTKDEVDPTTSTIQEANQNTTTTTKNLMDSIGSLNSEQVVAFADSFTNLGTVKGNINVETKELMINALKQLDQSALDSESPAVEEAVEEEHNGKSRFYRKYKNSFWRKRIAVSILTFNFRCTENLSTANFKYAKVRLVSQLMKITSPDGLSDLVTMSAEDLDASNNLMASEETLEQKENTKMTEQERTFVIDRNQKLQTLKVAQQRETNKKMAEAEDQFLKGLLTGENCMNCTEVRSAGGYSVTTQKNTGTDLASIPIISGGSSVEMGAFSDVDKPVKVAVSTSKNVVYISGDGQDPLSSVISSEVVNIRTDKPVPDGEFVVYQSMPEDIVYETYDPNAIIDKEDASDMVVIAIQKRVPHDNFCVAFQRPPEVERYELYVKFESRPTMIDYDTKAVVDQNQLCLKGKELQNKQGTLFFGIRTVMAEDAFSRRKRSATTTPSTSETTLPPIQLAHSTVTCLNYDNYEQQWDAEICETEWLPDQKKVKCTCNNPTQLTFANTFYVGPNKIDFSSVFLKFSPLNQAAVISTLCLILLLYVIMILWARRQDRKDVLKWGITPLADNFPEDNYFYIVKVHTGMRPASGTRSQVGFVLAGDEMDTGVRELYDGVRREFSTGSIMNFLLSTPGWLGPLEYIRIWHDNAGGGDKASWYLSKIEVQDVQRDEIYIFMAERWLAIEKEDGALECVVPVVDRDNLNVFRNRFFANAKDNLSESHIWVSVVYRPATSNFTRVQRVSCALAFVMLTMISNAMFFRAGENYETPSALQVGPFRFSLRQIYISVICALITTPATLLLIYLFRRSRSKLKTEHDLYQNPKKANRYKIPFMESWLERQQRESMELEQNLVAKGYPRFSGFYFPYWMVYVTWFLVFATVFLSGFFILLYSMEWGKQKSEEWLSTFFLSFFESVFCVDPIKIGIMALIFAVVFRSANDSQAMIDRKTIMKKYSGSLRGKSSGIRLPAPPLDKDSLLEARNLRQKELKMKIALKDIIVNVFLIWILFSISYSNRDNRSYYLHQDIVQKILQPRSTPKFDNIKTVNGFYDWIQQTAIPNLFPEYDVNGDRLHWRVRQFIEGGAAYRMGPPRLRQLRTTKDVCKIPRYGTVACYGKYSEPTEDTDNYCIGWKRGHCDPEEKVYKFSSDAWTFTSAFDIWGFPLSGFYNTYGGGGYIGKLDTNKNVSLLILDELYNSSWIDRQTRAVIFEFTLYCINTNIFSYSMFMTEFPETGGAITFYYILPLRVYQHIGALGMYTLACEVIFLIFMIGLTVQIIVDIYQQKRAYFSKFWQIMDFVGLIGGYVAIAMYVTRFVVTSRTIALFREDPKEFVNFYHIALWDQVFVLLLGVLVFIATIRLLNILGYNKRIGAVARVFTSAASELIWFGVFFVYVFVTYAVFGYLLFGSKLRSYMNVYRTLGTLFISMIGKSRFTEIENSDPVMSKIYFMIFIFFVVYLILTMFLAVLSKSIDQVHAQTKNDKSEEMVDFILNKFKNLFGFGVRNSKAPPVFNRNSNMPQRIHQLDNKAILEDIKASLTEAFGPKGMHGFEKSQKSPRIRLN